METKPTKSPVALQLVDRRLDLLPARFEIVTLLKVIGGSF